MPNQAPDAQERRAILRLARCENVGPITFRQLMQRYGTAGAALEALPELAKRGGGKRAPVIPPLSKIDDEIAKTQKYGARIIVLGESDYPTPLAAIEDAPPVLTIKGQVSLLHKRIIGIVGARNASLNGRKMAEILARDLGATGIVIASGLARGIDASAHKASLGTGTAAAMAGGIDICYPEENRALFDEIGEHGCLLSDQPIGCEPQARLFPRRNRLISGLSLGVIVVEAALKSGSLITARMALDQGREVFAVPGSPLDPRANGTNSLLREGATLVEGAKDVLDHIAPAQLTLCEPPPAPFESKEASGSTTNWGVAREKIVENLGYSPVAVDELVRQCQLSPSVVLTVLLELELAGRLDRQPGHKVALTS